MTIKSSLIMANIEQNNEKTEIIKTETFFDDSRTENPMREFFKSLGEYYKQQYT